jgi:hypothetical protein
LFLDLELGQVLGYPAEIVNGELQAAWLYHTVFSDLRGFYRDVQILDLENWGVRGWAINILRFIDSSVQKNYPTGLRPTIPARESAGRLFWNSYANANDVWTNHEMGLLRRLSTHSSARILEIALLNQYLRANNWDRTEYHNVIRARLSEAIRVHPEERGLTFETEQISVSDFGPFSNSVARSRAVLSTFAVDFDLMPNPFEFFESCMSWREHPAIDELVMAGVWNLHLETKGLQGLDGGLIEAIEKDFPNGQDYDYFVKWSTSNPELHHLARLDAELMPLDIVKAAYEVFWADYLEALSAYKQQSGELCFEFLAELSDLEFLGASFFAFASLHGHLPDLDDHGLIKLFYEGSQYRPALAKLKTKFSQHKLRLPSLPVTVLRNLRQHGDWSWSNRFEREELADYLLKLERGPSTEFDNLLSISWAGHGLNSYALSLNLKFGPIHILLKHYMGGVYGDPSADLERWNTLVDSFEPLFSELSRKHYKHFSGDTKIWVQNSSVFETVSGEYAETHFETVEALIEYVFQRLTH